MEMYKEINQEIGSHYLSDSSINYESLVRYNRLSERLMDKIITSGCVVGDNLKMFGRSISFYQKLSEDFVERNLDILDFKTLISVQDLSEGFIEKHLDKVEFPLLVFHRPLSEGFIERYMEKLDLYNVSMYQKLSESFIEKHIDKFLKYMDNICQCQNVSEEFIEKNKKHCYDFVGIFKYQKLSEDFIRRNINSLNYSYLSKYQKLSDEFRNEFNVNKSLVRQNWIYKDAEYKKKKVMNTRKYDCQEDYFIGYKAIRRDRYSIYNFKYKYEKGGIYESWCDCSADMHSFGLSVGTYEQAMMYGGPASVIVRCKVKYEDVGRVSCDGNIVRCFKIEILD